MDQPIEENSNLSSLNSNLSAFDSLDPDLQALVGDLAKRIYGGEEITFDSDLLHHTAKPLVDGLQKGYGKSLVEVEYNSPDYKALENLTKNAFKFSASKDFHILQDMTNALRDGDRVRSFDEFRAEVDKINVKYNQNWLRTEYNQAIAASQATARWQEFQENAKAMPFLQYQAVMDASTRPDHQKLHGVIKRIDNPFWNTHFPPLGWGCRCEVVQLPGKNHKETPDGSFQKPDVPPQFRENFGKKQQLFSDKHPYYQNKCQGCTKTAKLATENNAQCQACLNAMEQCKEEIKAQSIKSTLKGADNWNVIVKTKKEVSPILMDFLQKYEFSKLENFVLDKLKSLNIEDTQKFSLKILSDYATVTINGGIVKLLIHYSNENGVITNKLDSIRVMERYQRKGIGSSITKFLIKYAHSIGVSRIYFLADKAGGYAWASLANAKNRSCIMNIYDKRALTIIDDYYKTHKKSEPFPMNLLTNKEWSEEVLSQSSWYAEINF